MHNLFSNGCSYNQWRTVPPANVKTSVAEEVAKHYKLHCTNISAGGKGNDRIVSTTINYFLHKPERMKDTFALIQWSSAARMDYPSKISKPEDEMEGFDIQYRAINMYKKGDHGVDLFKKFQKMHLPNFLMQRYYQAVINLQNFFKVHNINYLMYNGLENEYHSPSEEHKRLLAYIDNDRFFKAGSQRFVHRNYCVKHNMELPNDGHASKKGVRTFAKLLIDHIDEKALLEKNSHFIKHKD